MTIKSQAFLAAVSTPGWKEAYKAWAGRLERRGRARRLTGPNDFALAVAAFPLLFMWQKPPWLVVILSAVGGSRAPA